MISVCVWSKVSRITFGALAGFCCLPGLVIVCAFADTFPFCGADGSLDCIASRAEVRTRRRAGIEPGGLRRDKRVTSSETGKVLGLEIVFAIEAVMLAVDGANSSKSVFLICNFQCAKPGRIRKERGPRSAQTA
jgi:hypothetical protein